MEEQEIDSDDAPNEFESPDADNMEAVVAFYERTGVMPVNSIGPPIDRPIIPSRRPDRVGDFHFTAKTGSVPPTSGKEEAEDPDAEKIRQEFLDMLKGELKGL
jgi:hypothetical protein